MEQKIKLLWEERSKKFGDKPEGVLQKSLNRSINDHLHLWMLNQIVKTLPKDNLSTIKILDLGCGYGRLAEPIVRKYPKVKVFGIDIAKTYVSLFNKKLAPNGKALVGDIKKLPFKDSSFDLIYMVTTMMYLTDYTDQQKAIKEIFRVLKPGGKFVFIERNPIAQKIVTLGGLIEKIKGSGSKEISAVGFTPEYLSKLIKNNKGLMERVTGIPFWTMFLPLLIVTSKVNISLCKLLLRIISLFDNLFKFVLTLSLYISYTGSKKNES